MIRTYQKGDVRLIIPQKAQLKEAAFLNEDEVLKLTAFTVTDSVRVTAVFGFEQGGEVIECFALIGENARGDMLQMVRQWKTLLTTALEHANVKKIRCTVKADFRQGKRLMRILNFRPQRVLKKFFCGEDYQLFEREK